MSRRVAGLALRGILESRGHSTVEAELGLSGGAFGRASAPVAIAPGHRERAQKGVARLGPVGGDSELMGLLRRIEGCDFETQTQFDAVLENLAEDGLVGADVTLALSLAFARAAAAQDGIDLSAYLGGLTSLSPGMPRPMTNIFSGGIHGTGRFLPFQNIMISPAVADIVDSIDIVLRVYQAVERELEKRRLRFGYSASSGIMVERMHYRDLLDLLSERIVHLGFERKVAFGIDVAAEHLQVADGRYRFLGRLIDGDALAVRLYQLTRDYDICFLEDPFAPGDVVRWRQLTALVPPARTCIVGDDLFATNTDHIVPGLATGILLKMSQIGTVSGTLRAAEKAQANAMTLCMSHRSGETEDTAMCDLALAVGAAFIKIGGPRRGDRIAKYNQLLRLAEKPEARSSLNAA